MKDNMENTQNNHIDAQENAFVHSKHMDNPLKTSFQEGLAKRVEKSTEFFLNHPDIVETYLDFCDSLVEQGETLEKAIEKSDKIFSILKDKNTYN